MTLPDQNPLSQSLIDEASRLLWKPGLPLTKQINYACGLNVMPAWTNTDFFSAESFPNGIVPEELKDKVYHVDLAGRHPFPDDQFEFAYCEDFIEHLDQKDMITFLFEARRCLKKGGVLRMSTPGLQEAMYRHYYGNEFEDLENEHYQCYTRWGHRCLYTHDSLRAISLACGFSRYRERTFGVSTHPDLENIDTRSGQIELNIIAELTK